MLRWVSILGAVLATMSCTNRASAQVEASTLPDEPPSELMPEDKKPEEKSPDEKRGGIGSDFLFLVPVGDLRELSSVRCCTLGIASLGPSSSR
jgi:hypothetical protein